MKNIVFLIVITLCMSCIGQSKKSDKSLKKQENQLIMKESIYQFKVKDIEGKGFDFSSLKGKKIMVVNTASECD